MKKSAPPHRPFPAIFAAALFLAGSGAARAVNVTVEAGVEKWTISSCLVGTHHVYSNDKDSIYATSDLIPWARRAGIGTSRYPGGGVVKYWDWEHPTGVLDGDPWDPKWNPAHNAPPADWMSLDEYLHYAQATGIRPCFGVNTLSGVTYRRVADSVARAVRMVDYVKARGFGGALWYLGNEEIGRYPGRDKVAAYARNFALHAKAMKAADPKILTFWNDNDANATRLRNFLQNDAGTADGLETHGKWPFGGTPEIAPGTFSQWLLENPLYDHKSGHRWRDFANTIRTEARADGRPGLLVANLEYGIGSHGNALGFTRYTKGLLMTDMLQEHAIGNWFATAFWSNVRDADEDGLVAFDHRNRLNPFHFGMELIAKAQGGRMLDSATDDRRVYGFAARKDGDVYLYLINKRPDPQTARIAVHGFAAAGADALVMRDTADGFGEIVPLAVAGGGGSFTAELPPLTYTRIRFRGGLPDRG